MEVRLSALLVRMRLLDRNLNDLGRVLSRAAQKRASTAAITKVIVIFLGAFVATRETVNQLLGASSNTTVIIFAITGLLIAVLTGLETAFKWENRSAELRVLAAACQNHKWELNPQIILIEEAQEYFLNSNERGQKADEHYTKNIEAVENFHDALEIKLIQVQEKAATLGINVAFEIANLKYKAPPVYSSGALY